MNEFAEALELLKSVGGHESQQARAAELRTLLTILPAVITRVRRAQEACLRAFALQEFQEARGYAAEAQLELARMEAGFMTERLQIPGAPPSTFRTLNFDGILCWTLRNEYNGELLCSGSVADQPSEAPRTALQVARDACYYQLRTIAQGGGAGGRSCA